MAQMGHATPPEMSSFPRCVSASELWAGEEIMAVTDEEKLALVLGSVPPNWKLIYEGVAFIVMSARKLLQTSRPCRS